jgi:hypothetical protein
MVVDLDTVDDSAEICLAGSTRTYPRYIVLKAAAVLYFDGGLALLSTGDLSNIETAEFSSGPTEHRACASAPNLTAKVTAPVPRGKGIGSYDAKRSRKVTVMPRESAFPQWWRLKQILMHERAPARAHPSRCKPRPRDRYRAVRRTSSGLLGLPCFSRDSPCQRCQRSCENISRGTPTVGPRVASKKNAANMPPRLNPNREDRPCRYSMQPPKRTDLRQRKNCGSSRPSRRGPACPDQLCTIT